MRPSGPTDLTAWMCWEAHAATWLVLDGSGVCGVEEKDVCVCVWQCRQTDSKETVGSGGTTRGEGERKI